MKFLIGLIIGILSALAYSEGLHLSLINEAEGLAREAEAQLANIEVPPLYEVEAADVDLPVVLTPKPKPEVETAAEESTIVEMERIETVTEEVLIDHTVAVPEVVQQPLEFQSAWMPFRSETSANGFADKLSTQLDRDFEVIRAGPGHYEVGFRFHSLEERDAVLVSIESITGYRVPSS